MWEGMESQVCDDIVDEDTNEWSDLKCIEIAAEDKFPDIVKDLNIQKQIISRFLNFYLSGKIQKGVTVTDVLFSSIAIMPRTWSTSSEDPMWQNEEYSEQGTLFFLSPEDKLHAEIKNIINNQNKKLLDKNEENKHSSSKTKLTNETGEEITREELKEESRCDNSIKETLEIKENISVSEHANIQNEVHEIKSEGNKYEIYENIKWFREKRNTNEATMTGIEYGSTENAAFCSNCNKILKEWDTNSQARIHLKFFFGLAALTLMRTITKSYENVINTFSSSRFYNNIRHLVDYSPPDKTCVKQCFKTFRRPDWRIKVMFAKLVINSFILDHTPSENKLKNVIKLGLLAHTAYFKMDLIYMLQTLSIHSYQTFHIAMEVLCEVEELSASMRKICDFIIKHVSVSETNYLGTCYWAPILEKGKFDELSCRENYNLAVVVAVFIEKLTFKQNIWNARWVQNGDNLQANKQLGLKIYQHYYRRRDEESQISLQIQFTSLNTGILNKH